MTAVLVFAVCVIACVVGQVAILFSVVRSGTAPVAANVPRSRLLIEIVWAFVPAVMLALLLTATWVRVRHSAAPKPTTMIKVAQ